MSAFDVASLIVRHAESVTLRRTAAPVQDAQGVYVHASPVDSTIQAAVQELSGRDLEELPEADRNRSTIQLYLTQELKVARGSDAADRIVWHGLTYRVIRVEDWSAHSPGVWLAYASLEDPT